MVRDSTMICRKCGASLEAEDESTARFCPSCGASFGPGASMGMKLAGGGSVLVGVLVLLGASWHGLASESKETQLLRADVIALEKRAADRQSDLENFGKEHEVLKAACEKQKGVLKEKQEELSACEGEIAKLSAANREEVSRASKTLDAAKKQLSDSKAVADGILRKEVDKARRKEKRIQLMGRYRKLVVTLQTSTGLVASGFFFDTGSNALIVTSDELAAARKTVHAKFTFRRGSTYYTANRSVCRLVRRDRKRGLAFYKPTMQRGWTISCIAARAVTGAAVGDDVFAIATNVVGGKVLDHTIHDGTVSSADRKVNGYAHIQTTLPYNPGCPGAPVVSADGKLVGVMIKKLGRLEKTSLAISAEEVSKSASGR